MNYTTLFTKILYLPPFFLDDTVVDEVVFKDVPVREDSTGSITVGTIEETGALAYDYNGDGTDDMVFEKSESVSAEEYLRLLNDILTVMSLQKPAANVLPQQVEVIQHLLQQREKISDNADPNAYQNLTDNIYKSIDRLKDMTGDSYQKGRISDNDFMTIMRFIDFIQKSGI